MVQSRGATKTPKYVCSREIFGFRKNRRSKNTRGNPPNCQKVHEKSLEFTIIWAVGTVGIIGRENPLNRLKWLECIGIEDNLWASDRSGCQVTVSVRNNKKSPNYQRLIVKNIWNSQESTIVVGTVGEALVNSKGAGEIACNCLNPEESKSMVGI